MNEQDFHQRLEKIEKHLEFFASSYKHLHNLCIQQTHIKINKELLEPGLSKLQDELRKFKELYSELSELVKKDSIVGTLAFMAKKLHKLEMSVHSIKEEGLKKKIHLDLTMDGYEMVRKKRSEDEREDSPETSLKKLMEALDKREELVLTHRYGLFGNEVKTLDATGKLIGVSRETVRAIQNKALRKCRMPSRKKFSEKITHKQLREDILGEEE